MCVQAEVVNGGGEVFVEVRRAYVEWHAFVTRFGRPAFSCLDGYRTKVYMVCRCAVRCPASPSCSRSTDTLEQLLSPSAPLFQVANLQLDDLEAGSLRGVLSSASLAADVAGRRGRGSVSAEGLRLSSLAVGSFGGAVRWEGDIVKLEETVLEQRGSRWGRSQVAPRTTWPVLCPLALTWLVMYAGSWVVHARGYRPTLDLGPSLT